MDDSLDFILCQFDLTYAEKQCIIATSKRKCTAAALKSAERIVKSLRKNWQNNLKSKMPKLYDRIVWVICTQKLNMPEEYRCQDNMNAWMRHLNHDTLQKTSSYVSFWHGYNVPVSIILYAIPNHNQRALEVKGSNNGIYVF